MHDGFVVFVSDVAKQVFEETGLWVGESDLSGSTEGSHRPYEVENFV